jgi:hypothetical protein
MLAIVLTFACRGVRVRAVRGCGRRDGAGRDEGSKELSLAECIVHHRVCSSFANGAPGPVIANAFCGSNGFLRAQAA